jgi:hypothetical protein
VGNEQNLSQETNGPERSRWRIGQPFWKWSSGMPFQIICANWTPNVMLVWENDCRLLSAMPIQFASWIGGDQDRTPNVTPWVTKEVVLHQ